MLFMLTVDFTTLVGRRVLGKMFKVFSQHNMTTQHTEGNNKKEII